MKEEEQNQIKKDVQDFLGLLSDNEIRNRISDIVSWELKTAEELKRPEHADRAAYQHSTGEIEIIDKILGWVKDFIFKRLQRGKDEEE